MPADESNNDETVGAMEIRTTSLETCATESTTAPTPEPLSTSRRMEMRRKQIKRASIRFSLAPHVAFLRVLPLSYSQSSTAHDSRLLPPSNRPRTRKPQHDRKTNSPFYSSTRFCLVACLVLLPRMCVCQENFTTNDPTPPSALDTFLDLSTTNSPTVSQSQNDFGNITSNPTASEQLPTASATPEPTLAPTRAPTQVTTINQASTANPPMDNIISLPTDSQSPPNNTATFLPLQTFIPSGSNDSEILVNTTQLPSNDAFGTYAPTIAPTISVPPSSLPSMAPSFLPSLSTSPSAFPSDAPSSIPSLSPSAMPSMSPTYNETVSENQQFIQDFQLEGKKFFNETEISLFEELMENYTGFFSPESIGIVNTTCQWVDQTFKETSQTIVIGSPEGRRLRHINKWLHADGRGRLLQQETSTVSVQYVMTYDSDTVNVSTYPNQFEAYINSNLSGVTQDMNNLGIPVTEASLVSSLFKETPNPTTSPQPSYMPTQVPTASVAPSFPPTEDQYAPSFSPSLLLMPSELPTTFPSMLPSAEPSESVPEEENTTIIVAVVIVVASLTMISLFIFYRRRKKRQAQRFQSSPSSGSHHKRGDFMNHQGPMEGSWNAAVGKPHQQKLALHPHDPRSQYSPEGRGPLGAPEGLISPSESLVSNQSLLSAGNSMAGDSGDEADTTQNLQDEFEQYKDQNLEKMRVEVEGNFDGADGMMSQALTKAFMDDDDVHIDPTELLWGGVGQQRGAEIEASALCEVMDWLKRNDAAPIDRKRNFMQDMLNKMVSSVRHGVLGPDDGSRAIHECAAMLNLQLASELPVNTVIISGMRKTVTASDMVKAFREFGEIDDAAVASKERGFGLVRFKAPKSVQLAHNKSVLEEVVVQDVAVIVRVVKQVGRR